MLFGRLSNCAKELRRTPQFRSASPRSIKRCWNTAQLCETFTKNSCRSLRLRRNHRAGKSDFILQNKWLTMRGQYAVTNCDRIPTASQLVANCDQFSRCFSCSRDDPGCDLTSSCFVASTRRPLRAEPSGDEILSAAHDNQFLRSRTQWRERE